MASKGILYIVISGPDAYQRALEGLRMAEYQAGDGTHGVALMLQGEGVEWLREGDEEVQGRQVKGPASQPANQPADQ